MTRILSGALFVLVAGAAAPQSDWDRMMALPGTTKTVTIASDDSVRTEIRFASGVTFFEVRKDGKSTYFSVDNSGHGAVMCSWTIYVEMSAAMDVCPDPDPRFKEELTSAIDRIDDFIVANSPLPVTKAAIEERQKAEMARTAKLGAARLCSGDFAQLLAKLRATPREKFRHEVDDLLSVPRPPVMNPCL